MSRLAEPVVAAALARYASADRLTRGFARGKLLRDPAYAGVILGDVLPREGLFVDLGCGRGLLLAALLAAGSPLRLIGVERREREAAIARRALGKGAHIEEADLVRYEIPPCDAIALLDVLHYLDRGDQQSLIARIAAALRPGGVLVVREADADAGAGFLAVRIAERIAAIARGNPGQRFCYRGRGVWIDSFEAAGLTAWACEMRAGTPFANDLIVARKV